MPLNPTSPDQTHSFLLPSHLRQLRPQGIQESEPVAQFELGRHRNFVYLILDWKSREAAVIDPQLDLAPLFDGLEKYGFRLTQALITHSHFDHIAGLFDHIAGLSGLMSTLPNISVWIHEKEMHRLKLNQWDQSRFQFLKDGQTFRVGNLNGEVLHTPGHSAGECCFLLEGSPPYLFTGDTVFIRDCGRTDLESGSDKEMFESLQKIRKLSPDTILLPGHHYRPECATVLGKELLESPPFLCRTLEELVQLP